MNRINFQTLFLSALSIILFIPGTVFPDEITEVWASTYKQAANLGQKYEIMLNIVEFDNRDAIPFLISALDELNNQKVGAVKKEKVIHNDIMILIVKELGDLKAGEAGPYIYRTLKDTEDPFLKGEAISVLGKTGAKEYTRDIALILRNLTLYRGDDVRGEKAIAYGCIVALERLKEPGGYASVFYALNAGFSRRITDLAEGALVNILEDPSKILKDVIRNDSNLKVKLNALKVEDKSNAPAENKVDVAYETLKQGLLLKTSDIREQTYLREIRVLAFDVFVRNKADDSKVVPSIEEVLYMNTDTEEKLFALEALRIMPNDEAAETLGSFLAYQNNRHRLGVMAKDNKLVISTIRAIKNANSNVGTYELQRTKYAGYSAHVTREAERAIKALE